MNEPIVLCGAMQPGRGAELKVVYPFDGRCVAVVGGASADDVEDAIAGAAAASTAVGLTPPPVKAHLLRQVAGRIESDSARLAETVSLETGKPIREARIECERAMQTFLVAAEEATRIGGEIVPIDAVHAGVGRWAESRAFPLGPVAAVTPFNSPLNLVAHKIAASLAAGNCLIVKPSPATPRSALALGQLVSEVLAEHTVPGGALSVLPCADAIAAQLVADPRIRAFHFTGSTPVGWRLGSEAVRTGKRILLELGGIGATIVHRDANIAHAASRCAYGSFLLAGQVCASVQRIYAHRDIYDTLLAALIAETELLRMGDPLDELTTLGPMINAEAADRAEQWVADAVACGARVRTGGGAHKAFFQPTILTDTDPSMNVVCQEVFAPVVIVEAYDTVDEALVEVNRPEGGLQLGLFTNDLSVVRAVYEAARVGGVIVNDINTWRVDHMPYGGWGSSGYGREGLRYSIRSQMEDRLLVTALPRQS